MTTKGGKLGGGEMVSHERVNEIEKKGDSSSKVISVDIMYHVKNINLIVILHPWMANQKTLEGMGANFEREDEWSWTTVVDNVSLMHSFS